MSLLIVPLLSPDLTANFNQRLVAFFVATMLLSGDPVGKRLSESRICLAWFWRVPDARAPLGQITVDFIR
jgi:hypothetical protein